MDDRVQWTIVVAAGSGTRFGRPKQFETLLGTERVLDRSVAVARAVSVGVVVVVAANSVEAERTRWHGVTVVAGGAQRSDSVRCGLEAVPADATVIAVHDAARPFASAELYRRLVVALADVDGVLPGMAVTDTIKRVDTDGFVVDTPARDTLRAVQTPQVFRADVLRRAHAGSPDGSDDAVLVEAIGGRVAVVDGEASAFKITVPADLDRARQLAAESR